MDEIGLPAYRFSASWPRVRSDGRRREPRGFACYDRLVDELLGWDIAPVVTLYHWDLPQALEDEGGWLARDTAARFADYAIAMHDVLGDRVRHWTTIDEPFCSAFLGYGSGQHAPGVTEPGAALVAAHHQLLAHGLAVEALRAEATPEQTFAIALSFSPVLTGVDDQEHREAAGRFDGIRNRFFLDPVLGRGYRPTCCPMSRTWTRWRR